MIAALVAAAIAGEIPVTTSVPAARAAFEEGRRLGDANRWVEARPKLEEAIRLDPAFAQARAYLGFALSGPDGQAQLDKAAADAARLPETERMLIQEMDAEGRGEHDRARNLALRLARLAPKDWRAQQLKGRLEVYDDHWESADEALSAAARLAPLQFAPWNALAYARMRRGDVEGAIAAARRCVELSPGEPNPLDTLAEMELAAGRFTEAEASFQRALAADPRFWIAAMGVAQARFLHGEWQRGRSAVDAALAIAPEIEQPRLAALSAWSYLCEHEDAAALKALDELEKQPGSRAPAIASVDRAMMLLFTGRFADSAQEARRALGVLAKLDLGGDDRAQLSRGAGRVLVAAFSAAGDLAEAQSALDALLEDARHEPLSREARSAVFAARAEIALAKNDPARALEALDACVSTDQWCRFRRVEVLWKARDPRASAQREAFLSRPWRDQIQFGDPPMYLYGRARLGSHSSR